MVLCCQFVSYVLWVLTSYAPSSHTTPKVFQNSGFTLKTHQLISVQASLEEFENATIAGHFGFVFEEN